MLAKIGMGEIFIILMIALLIFGPDKLPQLGRSVGKAIGSVKKYMNETTQELKEAMGDVNDLEKEVKEIGNDLKKAVTDIGTTESPEPAAEAAEDRKAAVQENASAAAAPTAVEQETAPETEAPSASASN